MAAPIVLLAVTALFVVVTALCREVLVLRARERRDLECYLQWLAEQATGPLTVAPLPRYR